MKKQLFLTKKELLIAFKCITDTSQILIKTGASSFIQFVKKSIFPIEDFTGSWSQTKPTAHIVLYSSLILIYNPTWELSVKTGKKLKVAFRWSKKYNVKKILGNLILERALLLCIFSYRWSGDQVN